MRSVWVLKNRTIDQEGEDRSMDYGRMAGEYLEEAERIDQRLQQLRQLCREHREADLWIRIGGLMEVRDDLRVMGHLLQRRAAKSL